MHPLAFQRVEIAGSVATSVLPSPVTISAMLPAVQNHAADQLHVVMPHAQKAAARLAAGGKSLDQQVVERFAGGQPAAEFDGLLLQLVVAHRLELGLQGVDGVDLCL